ncbi:MAG: molybdopterin-dependent oxidoreductase [Betaproteobacteria bacterium]|nr:molybdopterin-dependent oxidoreductase [Betaproteobacteria bacterium]
MHALNVNGRVHQVEADPEQPLLWVLRERLGLRGTKYGCGVGVCGACMVLLDGAPNHACMVPLGRVGARAVTTIEGLPEDHPLVLAWIGHQVAQCGYCQPAQLLSAAALLARTRAPSDAEIDAALSGVLCRCGTYARVRRAIHAAAHGEGADAWPRPELLSDLPPDAGTRMNDWIWIDPGGRITVMINHSEMGQGALTGLALLFAEELDVAPQSLRTVFAPADARYRNGLWGEQLTGGSSSIRGEWQRVRELAAKTRLRLVQAAARRWGVPSEQCSTAAGVVRHAASDRSLGYGELAREAAKLAVPRRAPLKSRAELRLIGRTTSRLDIAAMTLGRTRYGIDVELPGMLRAAVVHCPELGGRLARLDDHSARAVPGVREVVALRDRTAVAVVAEDYWAATRGCEALRIEWQSGEHGALEGARIERQLLEALGRKGRLAKERGEPASALRGSNVIEALYQTPYLAHAPIEPMNCVAHVRRGACDVWVGTQHQAATQKEAARIAGLPLAKVRVHTQFLGGGFGRRLETDFVCEAVELSKALGAPVQVLWNRAEDLQHDMYRPAHAVRLRAALDGAGRPAAWHMRIAGSELALDGIDVPYSVAHYREEHAEVPSALPTGAWRSVGASNNAFAVECFVDELAQRAGRDPLEYRLALLEDAPRHAAVLRLAAERAGWGGALAPELGRGVAVYESFGSVAAQVAEVRAADGAVRVERVVCAIDCGVAVTPDAVHAQLEGGIALGLSAALKEEILVARGRVAQASFQDYPILTIAEMPRIETYILESGADPGGVGEPAVPLVAPAVANALAAATGRRLRRLPLRLEPGA